MLSPKELLDEYFVENRNRLLEVAAFLDRLDRADPTRSTDDFRIQAFAAALAGLSGPAANHVTQIQMLLSDPTAEPIGALDRKSAIGAYDRWSQASHPQGDSKEQQMRRTAGRRFRLPDGSDRYLVDEALLMDLTEELGGKLADPLKTTVVQNQRCMTTWVVRKNV